MSAQLDRFVPRSSWGARQAKGSTGIDPTFGCTVHYEGPKMGSFPHASCATKVRAIQAYHMDEKGWQDIAYTAVVCPHGFIFEGRWIGKRTGANGTNLGNRTAYAICALIGAGDTATPELVDGIRRTAGFCRAHGRAGKRVNGHRDWKATLCPGDPLYHEVEVGTFEGAMPPPGPPAPTPGEVEEAELMSAKDEILDAVGKVREDIERAKPEAQRVSKAARHQSGIQLDVGEVWVVTPQGMYHVQAPTLGLLRVAGQIKNQDPNPVDGKLLATLPILDGPPEPQQ